MAQHAEASRGGLLEGQVVEASILEIDDALAANADEVVVIFEVGVEASLFVADVDT